MDEAIQEEHVRFKAYDALKKGGKMAEAKEAKTTYILPSARQSIPSVQQGLRQRKVVRHNVRIC